MDIFTVQEVIDKIDRKYQTPASDTVKIDYIKDAISELYRDIGFDDIYEFSTTEDVFMYQLPLDMKFENIRALTVSLGEEVAGSINPNTQIEYRQASNNEDLSPRCYFKVMEGYVGLYPTPTDTGQVVRISYQADADIVDATSNINLRGDYIKAIVYYVCAELGEDYDDIIKSNNFSRRYNDQIIRIKTDEYEKNGKFPVTKDNNIKPTMSARRRSGVGRRRYGTHTIPEAGRLY